MSPTIDFAVIGAGIAGASAGYELAEHGSVRVFEMEATAGHHSTGRSAALYTECDGLPPLRRLAMASRPFLERPPPGFAEVPILHERGVMFVARRDRSARLSDFFDEQRALVPSITTVDVADITEHCRVLRPDSLAGGVLEPNARDIDVHTLHQGFLNGLRRRGGTIHTSSPVSALEPVGRSWRVTTPDETVEAGTVVNAAGAWGDVVARMAGVRPVGLQPKRRTAFTFAAPGGEHHQSWPMVVDVDETFYFRPEGPNLLASPEDQTPVDPQDIRHEEVDVALAIDRIQRVTTMQIRSIQAAWAGLRSFVADNVPVVGFDGETPGFFWLVGQGGYGIMTSPAMSRLTAGLITSDRVPPDIAEHGISRQDLGPARLR